ncbi:hypothetical protein CRUP_005099 [Coryphaenoides rupestris]|nr:hypothetical protein CRUP_005099 [Coryphaenoides rupestris]
MSYWRLPGFQTQLLRELQRQQQNNSLHCISVPVHGCILAALSPYLSQKVSASPCPPAGQQRRVKLQVVNAQTLLKLVGLLYSGSFEGNESTDPADVLAAADQLGFDRLVEGWGDACNVEVQDGAKILRRQTEGTRESTVSTSQIGPVSKQQGLDMSLSPPQPPCDISTDFQTPSTVCYTQDNSDSMLALLSQAQFPDESDMEIEKLLEDIMMGLKILPSTGLREGLCDGEAQREDTSSKDTGGDET